MLQQEYSQLCTISINSLCSPTQLLYASGQACTKKPMLKTVTAKGLIWAPPLFLGGKGDVIEERPQRNMLCMLVVWAYLQLTISPIAEVL